MSPYSKRGVGTLFISGISMKSEVFSGESLEEADDHRINHVKQLRERRAFLPPHAGKARK